MPLDFGFLTVGAIIVLAAIVGLYMAWSIGANDVANAMGTSVGSGALTLKRAIILAAVLEFAGAVLAGGSVTNTVRKGILDAPTAFARPATGTQGGGGNGTLEAGNATLEGGNATLQQVMQAGGAVEFSPELYIYGMLAALLGTAIWLTLASWWGMPVSTTHSIVGGVIGSGMVAAGSFYGWAHAGDAVAWDKVIEIVQSWVFAPVLGGLAAFALFWLIKLAIFNHPDPLAAVVRWRPLFVFLDVLIIAMATLLKGLKNITWYRDLGWLDEGSRWKAWVASFVVAAVVTAVVEIVMYVRTRGQPHHAHELAEDRDTYRLVERRFVTLQIVTAGSVAFAHGANDVANAIGPLAGIVSVAQEGAFVEQATIAWWILPLGGIGIVLGLATLGWRVMRTIGQKISEITPSRGFAAELAAAATIILATVREIPVSTSQILVGAVLGVGLARGVSAIDLRVLRDIVASWLLTLPAAGLLSGILYLAFKNILGS